MADEKQSFPALRLKGRPNASTDTVVFPGFPGEWQGGKAVPLATLELSEKDAREQVKELGLPLEFTTVSSLPNPKLPAADSLAAQAAPGTPVPLHPPMTKVASGPEGAVPPEPAELTERVSAAELVEEPVTAEDEKASRSRK